jgi:hypothetical protein
MNWALLGGPWLAGTIGSGTPVRETIEEVRVAALEDRGDEQVFDIEGPAISNDFMTTPNERGQRHEAHFGLSVILNPYVGAAQVSLFVFDNAAKRHLRRIDEPAWLVTFPEHAGDLLLIPIGMLDRTANRNSSSRPAEAVVSIPSPGGRPHASVFHLRVAASPLSSIYSIW